MNMLCANCGCGQSMDCAAQAWTMLAWTIHGLLAQSVDRSKRNMDSDNPVILTYAIRQAV